MEIGTVSVRLAAATEGRVFTRSSSFWKNAVACSPEYPSRIGSSGKGLVRSHLGRGQPQPGGFGHHNFAHPRRMRGSHLGKVRMIECRTLRGHAQLRVQSRIWGPASFLQAAPFVIEDVVIGSDFARAAIHHDAVIAVGQTHDGNQVVPWIAQGSVAEQETGILRHHRMHALQLGNDGPYHLRIPVHAPDIRPSDALVVRVQEQHQAAEQERWPHARRPHSGGAG